MMEKGDDGNHGWSSLVCVETPNVFIGSSIKQRCWSLHHGMLTVSTGKYGTTRKHRVKQGGAWSEKELGIQVETEDGIWYHGMATSKVHWAMWMQAFQSLHPPSSLTMSPKKVNFHGKVRIRLIPLKSPDEVAQMHYSDSELSAMTTDDKLPRDALRMKTNRHRQYHLAKHFVSM